MTFVHAFTTYKAQFGTTDAKGALILNRDSYAATPFKTLRGFTVTDKPLLLTKNRVWPIQPNKRKTRQGAFWEDRYHATAIDTNEYLLRCLVYVDLNMVRTGLVKHPSQWPASGYNEIQNRPKRKGIINIDQLLGLLNIEQYHLLQQLHRQWIEEALQRDRLQRIPSWSESIAVGSETFVEKTKEQLKSSAYHLKCKLVDDKYLLKEPEVTYHVHLPPEKAQLRLENGYFWEDNVLNTIR